VNVKYDRLAPSKIPRLCSCDIVYVILYQLVLGTAGKSFKRLSPWIMGSMT
jgi:hypothetical protein